MRIPNKNKLIEGRETESGHPTPSSRQEKSGKITLPASVYTFKKLERCAVELKRQKHRGRIEIENRLFAIKQHSEWSAEARLRFDHHLPAHAAGTDRLFEKMIFFSFARRHRNGYGSHTGKLCIGIMNCGSFCTRSGRISCILLIASTHNFTVFEQHGSSDTKMRIWSVTRLRGCLSRFDQTHIGLRRNVDSGSQNTIRKMETGLFHEVIRIDNGINCKFTHYFFVNQRYSPRFDRNTRRNREIWPFFCNLAPQ